MKKMLKILIFLLPFTLWCFTLAENSISVIPGWSNVWDVVREISTWGKVWFNYRNKVKEWSLSLWDQFSSWIMSRDTILDYCVYLAKFLWQVALLIWALAIIFLWYQKIAGSIFTDKPKGLTMVVIWILVVIFAYVIVKLIWSAFIS